MEIKTGFTSFFLNKDDALKSKNLFNFVLATNGLYEIIKEKLYTVSLKRKKGFTLPLTFDNRQEFSIANNSLLLSKEGIEMQIKKNKFKYVKTWNFPFSTKMESFFDFNYPKIPFETLLEIIWFFKHIWKKSATEIMLEIYFNNDTQTYELVCPKQIVSPTKVIYLKEEQPSNYTKIMEIHSHNVMPAVFSATDDADEKNGNLIYGVIGGFSAKQTNCTLNFRIFSKGQFKSVHMDSLFAERTDDTDIEAVKQTFQEHYLIWKDLIELAPQKNIKKASISI